MHLETILACVRYKKKEKEEQRQRLGQNVSYSDNTFFLYFANSASLFILYQKVKKLAYPPPPLVKKKSEVG